MILCELFLKADASSSHNICTSIFWFTALTLLALLVKTSGAGGKVRRCNSELLPLELINFQWVCFDDKGSKEQELLRVIETLEHKKNACTQDRGY